MISVLMTSYGPQSQAYLNNAIKSVIAQTHEDWELILVSSGDFRPKVEEHQKVQHLHSQERLHNPAAVAMAYSLSNPSSEIITIANDDIVMNKTLLAGMNSVLKVLPRAIIAPLSNCDNGLFYQTNLGYQDKDGEWKVFSKPQYRANEITEDTVDGVMNRAIKYGPIFFKSNIVCFWCVSMLRKTYEDVGGIDTLYPTTHDDSDFCARALKKGYQPGFLTSEFCAHWSGVSADLYVTEEDRAFGKERFLEKNVRNT